VTNPISTTPVSTSINGTTVSLNGLASNVDDDAIIKAMLSVDALQQQLVASQKTTVDGRTLAWQAIQSSMAGITSPAFALVHAGDWNTFRATTTNSAIATATVNGTPTVTGSLTFAVDHLATAASVRSGSIYSSTSDAAAADAGVLLAKGATSLGFATVASDDALAVGNHTITVTQASAAATKAGDAALAGTTVIDGSNDTLQVTINGAVTTIVLPHGSYSQAALAAAVQAASAGALTATVDPSSRIVLTTVREGSGATLQVTGGTALTALQLSTDAAANTGSDGKVSVDGVETVLSNLEPGNTVTLASTAGAVSATLARGVRTGTVTATNVATGDRTLNTLVNNINAAQTGIAAAIVKVGTSSYRLQLSSTSTGADSTLNVDAGELVGAGSLLTLTAGSDAQITVGSGPGAYQITGSSNTLSDVLPGLSVNLLQQGAGPVTVGLAADPNALADKVQAMVTAANLAINTIQNQIRYDATTQTASPLTGDNLAVDLQRTITSALTGIVGTSSLVVAGSVGVDVDSTGDVSFDRSKFLAAYAANPSAVQALFVRSGTAASPDVSFVDAGDFTNAGTYDVTITQVATRAQATGLEGSWPIASPPVVRVKVGTTEADYTVQAGDQALDVVNGLNAQFRQTGLGLRASVSNGGGVQITGNDYGSGAKFSVAWDGSTWTTAAGTDVAGTINGVAATGVGQLLTATTSDKQAQGLSLRVTATSTGDLGDVTYTPGVAARLQTAVARATNSSSGSIVGAIATTKTQSKDLANQISAMQDRYNRRLAALKDQFATLETTLSQLKSQLAYITQQLDALSANNGNGK